MAIGHEVLSSEGIIDKLDPLIQGQAGAINSVTLVQVELGQLVAARAGLVDLKWTLERSV